MLKETKWYANNIDPVSWAGGEDTLPRCFPVKVFFFLAIFSHIFHCHTKDTTTSKSIISPNTREGHGQINVIFKYKF